MAQLSKEEIIHTTLSGLAMRLGPGAKLPTVRQLCAKLSASRSTMDRVLRSLESQRVVKCIQGSGIYVSQHIKQRKVGLVFPGNIHDPMRFSQFWGLLHTAALHIAKANGDELRTYFGCPVGEASEWEPSAYSLPDDLEARRLSGIISLGAHQEAAAWLKTRGLPIVTLGHNENGDASASFDPHANIHAGVEALVRTGCKNIAMVFFNPATANQDRTEDPQVQEFLEACRLAGLSASPENAWNLHDFPPKKGWQSLEELGAILVQHQWKQVDPKPDGIFFLDDTMAHGGLIELMEEGVKLGRDVQVASITHTGSSLLRPFWRYLIRVEIDPYEIMEMLFTLLGNLLHGINNKQRSFLVSHVKVINPKIPSENS